MPRGASTGHPTTYAEAGVPVWYGGMPETNVGRATNLALVALPGDISASPRYYREDVAFPNFELNPDQPGQCRGQRAWTWPWTGRGWRRSRCTRKHSEHRFEDGDRARVGTMQVGILLRGERSNPTIGAPIPIRHSSTRRCRQCFDRPAPWTGSARRIPDMHPGEPE